MVIVDVSLVASQATRGRHRHFRGVLTDAHIECPQGYSLNDNGGQPRIRL